MMLVLVDRLSSTLTAAVSQLSQEEQERVRPFAFNGPAPAKPDAEKQGLQTDHVPVDMKTSIWNVWDCTVAQWNHHGEIWTAFVAS